MNDESCSHMILTLFACCWGFKLISCSIIFLQSLPPIVQRDLQDQPLLFLKYLHILKFSSSVSCGEQRPQEHYQFLQLLRLAGKAADLITT